MKTCCAFGTVLIVFPVERQSNSGNTKPYLAHDAGSQQDESAPEVPVRYAHIWGEPVLARKGDELTQISKEERVPNTANPLQWWAVHASKYPKLSRAAKDYLSARSTSADSERMFSGGRHMI